MDARRVDEEYGRRGIPPSTQWNPRRRALFRPSRPPLLSISTRRHSSSPFLQPRDLVLTAAAVPARDAKSAGRLSSASAAATATPRGALPCRATSPCSELLCFTTVFLFETVSRLPLLRAAPRAAPRRAHGAEHHLTSASTPPVWTRSAASPSASLNPCVHPVLATAGRTVAMSGPCVTNASTPCNSATVTTVPPPLTASCLCSDCGPVATMPDRPQAGQGRVLGCRGCSVGVTFPAAPGSSVPPRRWPPSFSGVVQQHHLLAISTAAGKAMTSTMPSTSPESSAPRPFSSAGPLTTSPCPFPLRQTSCTASPLSSSSLEHVQCHRAAGHADHLAGVKPPHLSSVSGLRAVDFALQGSSGFAVPFAGAAMPHGRLLPCPGQQQPPCPSQQQPPSATYSLRWPVASRNALQQPTPFS